MKSTWYHFAGSLAGALEEIKAYVCAQDKPGVAVGVASSERDCVGHGFRTCGKQLGVWVLLWLLLQHIASSFAFRNVILR
jgi:hypothetical protein